MCGLWGAPDKGRAPAQRTSFSQYSRHSASLISPSLMEALLLLRNMLSTCIRANPAALKNSAACGVGRGWPLVAYQTDFNSKLCQLLDVDVPSFGLEPPGSRGRSPSIHRVSRRL